MKKIKNTLTVLAALITSMIFMAPGLVLAATTTNSVKSDIQCGIDSGSGAGGNSASCSPVANSGTGLDTTIHNIINIMSAAVGIIAVIMLVVGGFRYITSAGNDQSVASAKKTILYALIGLIVAVLAQVIVRFVLKNATQ